MPGQGLSQQNILAERLARQGLTAPLQSPSHYERLFRKLQPGSPIYFSCPGEPPRLTHRTAFDDASTAEALRSDRSIVKGRFLGGTVGYVWKEDLEIYANAFCKPLAAPTPTQADVLEAVLTQGPITPRQLREETGLLSKYVAPALERLQQAFLVYEDQVDCDWERSWYDFSAEWPEITVDESRRLPCTMRVIETFIASHAFATFQQIKDWSRLPVRMLREALTTLEKAGGIAPTRIAGLGEGWLAGEARPLGDARPPACVFMLHKADPLVRSHSTELRARFEGLEVLQYLLIDGVFAGAVCGHWRIGPHDVENIVVTLSKSEQAARRPAILEAVGQAYRPPFSRVRAYCGILQR